MSFLLKFKRRFKNFSIVKAIDFEQLISVGCGINVTKLLWLLRLEEAAKIMKPGSLVPTQVLPKKNQAEQIKKNGTAFKNSL